VSLAQHFSDQEWNAKTSTLQLIFDNSTTTQRLCLWCSWYTVDEVTATRDSLRATRLIDVIASSPFHASALQCRRPSIIITVTPAAAADETQLAPNKFSVKWSAAGTHGLPIDPVWTEWAGGQVDRRLTITTSVVGVWYRRLRTRLSPSKRLSVAN